LGIRCCQSFGLYEGDEEAKWCSLQSVVYVLHSMRCRGNCAAFRRLLSIMLLPLEEVATPRTNLLMHPFVSCPIITKTILARELLLSHCESASSGIKTSDNVP
jgi:hypothetical protein